MSNLPVADLLAAAVIVICIIVSLTRGIIAEAGAMVAWVVSFIAARTLAVPFADVVFKSVEPHSLAVAMGFAAVFFLAWLLQKLARSLLSSLMSAVGLGSINRLLGGVFGAVKGVILVTLAVMVFHTLICRKRKSGKARIRFRILNHLPMLRCLICLEKIPQCRIFRVKQLKLKNWMIEFDGFRRPMGRLNPFLFA